MSPFNLINMQVTMWYNEENISMQKICWNTRNEEGGACKIHKRKRRWLFKCCVKRRFTLI